MRVNDVTVSQNGYVVEKMLATLKSVNRVLWRHEGNLSRSSTKIERDKVVDQVVGEDVKQKVDGEPSVESLVSWVHDLDERLLLFESGKDQDLLDLFDDGLGLLDR